MYGKKIQHHNYKSQSTALFRKRAFFERLESIYGIEYNEEGIFFKTSKIRIQGGIRFEISGPLSEVKPVFNFIQSIINKVDNPFIRRLDDS